MLTGLLTINLIMHTFQKDLKPYFNGVKRLFPSLASLLVKGVTDHVKAGCKLGLGLLHPSTNGNTASACFVSGMRDKK